MLLSTLFDFNVKIQEEDKDEVLKIIINLLAHIYSTKDDLRRICI